MVLPDDHGMLSSPPLAPWPPARQLLAGLGQVQVGERPDRRPPVLDGVRHGTACVRMAHACVRACVRQRFYMSAQAQRERVFFASTSVQVLRCLDHKNACGGTAHLTAPPVLK